MANRNTSNKRPSMFEVAKLAGVSHQTVSRVINHSPDVAAATRDKVLRAIEELDYHPNNSARALTSRRSRTIGLIAGGQHFFGPLSTISSIEAMARAKELFVTVSMVRDAQCTQEEFDTLVGTFEEQNVDAFILLAPTDSMYQAACNAPITQPRVFITSTHGGVSVQQSMRRFTPAQRSRISIVGIDQWQAMARVMQLVKENGHRSVLYFAGPKDWRDAATRLSAWNELCAINAVSSVTIQCATWDSGEAYSRMNHVLDNIGNSGGTPPTCVVTANDNQAVGVIRALLEHGVHIPQDTSVVGFDDMPAMADLYPPLTTVRPDFDQLGTAAMQEVLYILGESNEPGYANSQHGVGLIPAHVMTRRSLGPAPHR